MQSTPIPLLTCCINSLKARVIAKVGVFVSNIASPPLKRRYKRYGLSYFFVMRVGGLHVFKENLKSVHLIKKHRNNFLFSYYDLGFRCFELNFT